MSVDHAPPAEGTTMAGGVPHGEGAALLVKAPRSAGAAHERTSDRGALCNVVCTMAGTGILGLPAALKLGGWSVVALMFVVALTTNYTAKALIKCHYSTSARGGDVEACAQETVRRLASYADVGHAAFGRTGRAVVHVFHKATLLGVSTLFVIVTATFLFEVIGGGGGGLVPGLGSKDTEALWQTRWRVVTGAAVLIPVVSIKTLNEMPVLAAFGLGTTLLTVLCVVVLAVAVSPLSESKVRAWDLPGFETSGTVAVAHKVFDGAMFPTAFATITLSFGGHAVFPTIEEHMANPPRFDAVMNKAYVILMGMYLTCAVAGYAAFGDHVGNPVLSNMPRAGHLAIFGTLTKLAIVVHVMCAYCILMNTALCEFERCLGIDGASCNAAALRSAFRSGVVVCTVVVAICVPYFAEVMAFLGSACLTVIVYVCPVLFSFKLRHDIPRREKAVMVFVLLLGLTGGSIGCYQSVSTIVRKLQAGDTE
eukprot:TRINITY_DN22_c0_g1_i4.p1 TRINITY_DN22_c0_g1~~TRINITY_DN22_c0_g1_i4.p1  ORF type:complete len:480 (+),score=63.34 TRINITY_DN22_c0_g1_i4:46-1485(+)